MAAKIKAGSWSYTLSAEDKLWSGRMAQWEGGNLAATLWTMTQAFAQPSVHSHYGTFTRFIQGYSQPINPTWRLGGSHCPVASSDPSSPCSSDRLRRREIAASAPWSSLDPEVRATVDAWYGGTLPNPVPKAVEFADNTVGQHFLDNHPDARAVLRSGGNIYIATASSLRWPAGWVGMEGVALGIAAVVLLALAAGGGYAYYRKRKGLPVIPERLRRRRPFGAFDPDEQLDEDITLVGDWWDAAEELDEARRGLSQSRDNVRYLDSDDPIAFRNERNEDCQEYRANFKKMRIAYGNVRKLQSHPRWHIAIKDALEVDPTVARNITKARDQIDHAHAVARVAGKEYEKAGCPSTEAGPWLLPSTLLGVK